MACPHVSGACALAVSYYYGNDKRPGLTPDKLRAALLSSARPFESSLSSAYIGNMGVGMLDTFNLLNYMNFLSDMPDRDLKVGESVAVDLTAYFPSMQVISYSVSDETVIEAGLEDNTLSLTALKTGKTTVTVSDGNALYKKFEITVSK